VTCVLQPVTERATKMLAAGPAAFADNCKALGHTSRKAISDSVFLDQW
jgi:hypothetical protein